MEKNKDYTKIIIVSDIKGDAKSIHPYGFNLAKFLHAEVNVLHVIDSRLEHGVPSRYADSQTLSPGPKLSHKKIIEREVKQASMMLDKMISQEASRLNYPLKVKKVIKVGSIKEEIQNLMDTDKKNLLLINSETDDYHFHNRQEMIEVCKNIKATTLLVPPNLSFEPFHEITLITDFSNNYGINAYEKNKTFLRKFKPFIMAIDVAKPARFLEKKLKSEKWREHCEANSLQTINTKVLKGKNRSGALDYYINKEKPNLIIYAYRKLGFLNRLFHRPFFESILNNAKYPVIYMA